MFSRFINANRRLSLRVYGWFPQYKDQSIWPDYLATAARLADEAGPGLALDVGGGRACRWASLKAEPSSKLLALDISHDELAHNPDVDLRIVGDAASTLPLLEGSLDLIASQSVIEHLADTQAFINEAYRALKPGGHLMALFPSRFAPFSLLNQMLPAKVSHALLERLTANPEELGFEHHYDHCHYGAISKLLDHSGFEPVELRVSYAQSDYFSFFFPLFLLSAGYEWLVRALGLKSLAAYVFFVARKPLDG